ncbi:MAG: deubiquitinating enzyme [Chrysothrix sp. TS-e1954]|nr:MAG: deubiquitinating enzyme [Chrysothrix sp. TS-e1954]
MYPLPTLIVLLFVNLLAVKSVALVVRDLNLTSLNITSFDPLTSNTFTETVPPLVDDDAPVVDQTTEDQDDNDAITAITTQSSGRELSEIDEDLTLSGNYHIYRCGAGTPNSHADVVKSLLPDIWSDLQVAQTEISTKGLSSSNGLRSIFKSNAGLAALSAVFQKIADGAMVTRVAPAAHAGAVLPPAIICAEVGDNLTTSFQRDCAAVSGSPGFQPTGTNLVILCPPFFVGERAGMPRDPNPAWCPHTRGSTIFPNGPYLQQSQRGQLVHELAHMYMSNALFLNPEVYLINDACRLSAASMRRNPSNYAFAYSVIVKHAGKKHTVDVDPSSTGETFKYQLYSMTNVEPERQKILVKGGQLKDDQDMSKLGLKKGQTLMMMGTPSGDAAIEKPKEQVKFLEDMTEAEAAQTEGAQPAGLQNLGNTCYLNSTLQALRAIPELQQELAQYNPSASSGPTGAADLSQFGLGGLGATTDLTSSLKDLYKQMSETQEGFPPMIFLNAFRTVYPQFAERSRDGRGYAQQDAEEAWSQIIQTLRGKLKTAPTESTNSAEARQAASKKAFVDDYLGGKFERQEECMDEAAKEAGENTSRKDDETFFKLNCHVASQDVRHLGEGITAALTDTYTKTSPTLNREAEYKQISKIGRLPKYLPVHFVRFYWKNDVRKKAKILRKVTFPHELDATDYCTDDLRQKLLPVRNSMRELQKEEVDVERARKRQKRIDNGEADDADRSLKAKGPATEKKLVDDKKIADAPPKGSTSNGDVDMKDGEHYKTDADIEAERAKQILEAKQTVLSSISPELAADKTSNQTGLYELRGVLTHQGASADSGHYTAYVKKEGIKDPKTGKRGEEDGKWWWFNDEKVSEVDAEKIETLSGGGESHSALILLYRAVELPKIDEEKARASG